MGPNFTIYLTYKRSPKYVKYPYYTRKYALYRHFYQAQIYWQMSHSVGGARHKNTNKISHIGSSNELFLKELVTRTNVRNH